MTTPEAAFGRLPLKGATLAAWRSQIRGVRLNRGSAEQAT
jgi:hypothetical protein